MQRVDYDQIAQLYDEPLRDHALDPHLVTFLGERTDLTPDRSRILDVGCGTGKQVVADRGAYLHLTAIGLDLHAGMLALAQACGPGITWVQGEASRLPFRSATFDYATNQFSYHHVQDKLALVNEVFRVLTAGGRFVMTNIDPWAMPCWSIYQFFPEAQQLDHQHFLKAETFAQLMGTAGFVDVRIARGRRRTREPIAEFLAYARQRHRASQLMALADVWYQAGPGRLEQAANELEGGQAMVDSESCLLTIRGDKP